MRLFGMVSTRGSAAFTPHALRSLLRHTSLQPEDQVLLILNDGVAPNEIPHFPQLKLLRNEQPLGFSANMNRVLRAGLACNADVYLLNNDVIFTSGWSEMLEGSVDTIRVPLSNREVRYRASVGTPNSSAAATTFETDTVMTLEQYVDMPSALDFIVESHRRNSSGYLNVLTAPFFCVRIPYAIIDTIGLLDEGFGRGGGEDYDYCLRAILAGYGVQYALGSFMLHFGGTSSYSGVEQEQERLAREAHFFRYFEEKWGEELTKLALREDSAVIQRAGLEQAIAAGQYRHTVQTLLRGREVALQVL